jgi:hypothetical protein
MAALGQVANAILPLGRRGVSLYDFCKEGGVHDPDGGSLRSREMAEFDVIPGNQSGDNGPSLGE